MLVRFRLTVLFFMSRRTVFGYPLEWNEFGVEKRFFFLFSSRVRIHKYVHSFITNNGIRKGCRSECAQKCGKNITLPSHRVRYLFIFSQYAFQTVFSYFFLFFFFLRTWSTCHYSCWHRDWCPTRTLYTSWNGGRCTYTQWRATKCATTPNPVPHASRSNKCNIMDK
jgi:hypothetical protein